MNTRHLVALALTMAATSLAACTGDDADDAGSTSGDTPSLTTPGESTSQEPATDGISTPPWPAPTDVPARVAAAGLDLGPMGTAEHYHPHLSISINGTAVPVPPNIGVDPTTGAMSALHTHEGDGTIHIEADTRGEVFTLGQLFTEWGVALSATQVGGVRAEKGERVTVTSNGAPVTGDPGDLRLEPDQQIVVTLP